MTMMNKVNKVLPNISEQIKANHSNSVPVYADTSIKANKASNKMTILTYKLIPAVKED
jgi:hypothetical protein